MLKQRRVALVALVITLAGCGSKGDHAEGEGSARPASPATAAPAEAGMCKEHGVLEAVCTKCKPQLAPIFKAKGDWCEEHDLPESFCPICHPEKGGRPSENVAAEEGGAPADRTKVKFKKKETEAEAGLLVEKAVERPIESGVTAVVRIAYDGTKVAQINARSPGVIAELLVDVGAKVKRGDPLLVINSAEVGADRSRLTAAAARVKVAEEAVVREQWMQEGGASTRKSVLAAQQELADARAEQAAIAASLTVLGKHGRGPGGYSPEAPLGGVVTDRKASVGQLVGSDQILLEIVDTSTMWAELDIPEVDLMKVRAGQTVALQLEGLGDRRWTSIIDFVAPSVDVHTRTARARVRLDNPDGALRANMFGEARIAASDARLAVVVPAAAVQRAKDVQLVFVRLKEGEYEARRVELGVEDGELVEVKKGVEKGEDVVTQGSFLLKTETLKESIGAGCCEGE